MADILNLPTGSGTSGTFNSGVPLLDVIRKQPKALFLADSGVEFTSGDRASIAAFVTALKTKTRNTRGNRVYPILDLKNYEDKSKEPTRAAIGNLDITETILSEGVPAFEFQHAKGDLFHQQLSAAQNANLTLFILDSGYVLHGTKTAGGNLAGYSLTEFYAELVKFATASNRAAYPFSVVLASLTEYKENHAFVQLDSTVLNVKGNIDTTLALASQVTNVANISVTGRGGKNLGDLYSTQLAVIGAWVITNTQTGANVTVTSVSYSATTGLFTVTADNTAYGALTTGQKFDINLVSAAALSALGVDGFESTGAVQIVHA